MPPKRLGIRCLAPPLVGDQCFSVVKELLGGLNSGGTPIRCKQLSACRHRRRSERKAHIAALEFTIDLGLYIDVLKRHRLLVLSGLVVALSLAMLSYVRVSADGLTYRNPEIWSNEATLELSDPSYPELRSTLPPTADPNRFTTLVEQYVALATSDDVLRSLMKQRSDQPKARGERVRRDFRDLRGLPHQRRVTPLLKITGMATSPVQATRLTIRATDTLIKVATARQVKAKIPESQRVKLRISTRASVPKLIGPRSKTSFIIILLGGLTATVAAAFMRDNIQRKRSTGDRPRFRSPRAGSTAAGVDRVGARTGGPGERGSLRNNHADRRRARSPIGDLAGRAPSG